MVFSLFYICGFSHCAMLCINYTGKNHASCLIISNSTEQGCWANFIAGFAGSWNSSFVCRVSLTEHLWCQVQFGLQVIQQEARYKVLAREECVSKYKGNNMNGNGNFSRMRVSKKWSRKKQTRPIGWQAEVTEFIPWMAVVREGISITKGGRFGKVPTIDKGELYVTRCGRTF